MDQSSRAISTEASEQFSEQTDLRLPKWCRDMPRPSQDGLELVGFRSDHRVRGWRRRPVISGQRVQLCARTLRAGTVWNRRRNSDLLDKSSQSGECSDRRPKLPAREVSTATAKMLWVATIRTSAARASVRACAADPEGNETWAYQSEDSAVSIRTPGVQFVRSTHTDFNHQDPRGIRKSKEPEKHHGHLPQEEPQRGPFPIQLK